MPTPMRQCWRSTTR